MVQPDAIACATQALLYGVYFVSFAHCLRCLVFDREGRPKIHWPMTIVTVALFVLMTLDLAVVFQLMMLSLDGQSGSSTYTATYIVAAGIGGTVLLIVDGVLIYRCWIIYSKSWLTVILPLAFLWTADLVAAITGIVFLVLNHGWPTAQQQNFGRYSYDPTIAYLIFFSCEIAINIYATFAIFLQILRVTKWHSKRNSGRLYKIGLILVESGILFTITCVLTLCLKVKATEMANLQLASVIMNVINFSTAGLTFNLILIRILKEKASEGSQDANKTTIELTTVHFNVSTSGQTSESELP